MWFRWMVLDDWSSSKKICQNLPRFFACLSRLAEKKHPFLGATATSLTCENADFSRWSSSPIKRFSHATISCCQTCDLRLLVICLTKINDTPKGPFPQPHRSAEEPMFCEPSWQTRQQTCESKKLCCFNEQIRATLLETNISRSSRHFWVDGFPFPMLGYVSCLEGIHLGKDTNGLYVSIPALCHGDAHTYTPGEPAK